MLLGRDLFFDLWFHCSELYHFGLGPSDEVDSEFEPPSTGSMDLCCRSTSSSVASFSKVRVSIAESVSTVVEVISV